MFHNGGDQNLDEFTQELFSKLITATRISNNLPSEDEYQFYASFKPFKTKMNLLGKRLLDLTQNFLHHDENAKAPTLNDTDDVDEVTEKFDEVVDFVDRLIEKVDLYAEESSGEKPKSNIVITKVTAPSRGGAKADYTTDIFHSTNLARPQLQFTDVIDNSTAPFIPKITHKPNPLVPLDPVIVHGQAHARSSKSGGKAHPAPILGPGGFYPHPYEYELRALQFLDSQLVSRPEIIYKSLEDTPYTWIDTLEGLQILADKLDQVDEIAVDLEAHAYRTFQGFVCLMQVSTRREDFIIDTLVLRQHMHILNSSFTNPNIVKVLHGSDGGIFQFYFATLNGEHKIFIYSTKDILWLQRDFGIYVVNLFDTGQATRVLEYPSFGLAYLLKFYCNVDADKKYQLADWRIRAIPEEMIKYAREDTHYLLYVYDRLRNELVSRGNAGNNLLLSVLNRSRDLCMRRYEKERLDETSHLMLYNKILPNHTTIFNALQMKVFAALYAWRDNIARAEDESTRYVLPNQIMFEVAAQMPAETGALMSCCSPVPPLVRQYAADILQLVKRTKDKYQTLQPQQSIIPESSPPMRTTFFPTSANSSFTSQSSSSSSLHQPQQQYHQLSISKQNSLLDSPAPHTAKIHETPANGYNTHTNTPSPVLTTEQLYKTAGWLTEDDPEREPLKFTDDIPATPASPATPRARRRAILAKASTGVLFSAQSSSESDEEEDEAKRTAALIRSSFTSIVNASFPSFASMVVPVSCSLLDTRLESFDTVQSTSIPKPAAVPAKEEDEADGDDESETNAEEVASSEETKPPADGAQKKVPRSMAEIYKLSNQNRKRNKEKKKLKEDSLNTTHASPSSPVVLDENESSPVSRSKKQKTNHAAKRDGGDKDGEKKDGDKEGDGEDTVQFMKEIGWITKIETKNPPQSGSASTNNSNSTSSSNVNFGNASGPGDVKSSASHTGKPHPHHSSHQHSHSHSDDNIASSPPRNKNRQQQQQQPSPKQPSRPHTQQPHHKPAPQHAGGKHSHQPTTGHSGAPIPNFSAFDYNAAPSFNMVAPIGAPAPGGQFYTPFNGPNQNSNQTRVNPTQQHIMRRPPQSATFRPTNHHQRT